MTKEDKCLIILWMCNSNKNKSTDNRNVCPMQGIECVYVKVILN